MCYIYGDLFFDIGTSTRQGLLTAVAFYFYVCAKFVGI